MTLEEVRSELTQTIDEWNRLKLWRKRGNSTPGLDERIKDLQSDIQLLLKIELELVPDMYD